MQKNKKKFKADKISGIPTCLFLISNVLEVIKACNARCKFKFPFYGLTIYLDDYKSDEWVIDKKFQKESRRILKFVKRNGTSYFKKIVKKQEKEIKEFKKYSHYLFNKLPNFNDQELVVNFTKMMSGYNSYFGLGAISFIYEHIFSEWLAESLMKKYDNAVQIMNSLLKTDYKSFMIEGEQMLYKIKQMRNQAKKDSLVDQYLRNFFYLKASYVEAPVMDAKRISREVKNLEKQHKSSEKSVDDDVDIEKIKLTNEEKLIVDVLKITEVIRDKRKVANLIGLYAMDRFLDELVRRKKINKKLAQRAFWFEFEDLVFCPSRILSILKRRKYASIVYDQGKAYHFNHIAIKPAKKIDRNIKTIKGTPASGGMVEGRIIKVIRLKDFKRFKKGFILVAEMTRPDFLPVMKMASAIITDEGGLTSHAAIVSRELGIPCIVGTKIATGILSDGDRVLVDAYKGVVKKL